MARSNVVAALAAMWLGGLAACGDNWRDAKDAAPIDTLNIDAAVPGITVSPTSGLTTTEAGGQATFTIVLQSQPTADVTIALGSSNPGEGTVDPASVTFTSDDWNAPQTVTVTGVDDAIADGDQAYTIVTAAATSSDAAYSGLAADDVMVTNLDDDSPAIRVSPTSGLVTTEAGGTDTFTIVLGSQPTADVTIALSSSDPGEGTVDPASVTFTAANYDAPQPVTVTGVDDDVEDGDQPYTIVTAAAVSSDTGYAGLDPADVSATNDDNDTAGVTVTPTSGLVTTESGGSDSFTIVLHSQPVADVSIQIASSDPGEGTTDVSSVTFTSGNWNAPQTVTVTGVDDAVADGDQPYTIQTGATTSSDPNYSGLAVADVSATNQDNDSPGITVSPVSGLVTTEAGGQATFTIVLHSQPTADVTIGVTSSDTGEGTVSPASVTFTSANWNAPQTITVTGVDDAIADGDQVYSIITDAAVSVDSGYAGRNPADVSVTNTDNDSAGITVTPTSGLTTTEAGGTATFTVVLNSQPTADVTIAVDSNDTTEGVTDVSSLTFTANNWNAPQTVTITGQDDAVADGNQPYLIVTNPAVSADGTYNTRNAADVSVTNLDNDSANIVVTPISGLVTTEGGGTATFTVVLTSQPVADVTINVSSSDTTEGTVAPTTLTFTAANYNAPQTVTVTGVDDAVADGDQPYTIITAAATSLDPNYAGRNPADVSVTNTDNDSPGITVTPTSGLTTTEAGGQATFTIVLQSQPTADVTIDLSSSDTGEGTVSPASVTFTAANYNAPQTVTVTGVDDAVADGNQPYTIVTAAAVSADGNYSGRNPLDVSVTNVDNDSAGFVVAPQSGLVTTESGGSASFTVVLTSQPTANVTVPISSSDTTEGTVSTSNLTFTPANYNAPQTVTITGVDDAVADGDQPYTIVTGAAISADAGYAGKNPPDVSVTNTDNDSAGITVTPTTGLTTTEAGGTATFTIVLNSQPTAPVTIALSSSDTSEGTIDKSSVTFTPLNYNAPQTITITGQDDAVADGNQPYTIVTAAAVSSDSGYSGRDAADVSVTNVDNDSAGISVVPTSGLTTTEAGGQATFTIVLNSQPTADVTISLTSSDPGEGTLDRSSVTFTSTNYAAPQTVTITGVDDAIADGDQPYTIITGAAVSGDSGYNGKDPADVSVTNIDNDSAGITVAPTSGLTTTEAGGTATFTIVLNSQPTGDVTIPLSSSDTTEGTVSPTSVTFTSLDWNAPQTVTITGVDDAIADGDQPYTIVTGAATSTDGGYSGRDAADVSVTNTDNDSPGITVLPTSGLTTTEAGGQATFTIVLNSQPVANVSIDLTSSNTGEGTVSPSTVTFTTLNWNAPQTVTITGVDDAIADGNQPYTIVTAPAVSTDTGYSGLNAADVSVTNTDNDSANIIVSPTSGLTTSESGGTDTFTIVLTSQPTADVTIALSSSRTSEGTVSPPSITFTAANWNSVQSVTVTGVDDAVQDGNQPYTIVTAAAVSGDPSYNGINPSDVSVSNVDNDTAGFTVVPTSGLITDEFGTTDTFTIVLNSQPTADVTVGLSSSDTTEATVAVASVTFTTANWNVPQTVTVRGVDDLIVDGDQPFTIVTAPAVSADGNYNGLNPPDVTGTNLDNDSPGVSINPPHTNRCTTSENGTNVKFRLRLNTQPAADVTCTFFSTDTTEGTVAPTTMTFTPANFATRQTLTITGVDDLIVDGDQAYQVISQPCTSTDAAYNGINPRDFSCINKDND